MGDNWKNGLPYQVWSHSGSNSKKVTQNSQNSRAAQTDSFIGIMFISHTDFVCEV